MKASADMAAMIGWQVRNLHYVKNLKPLAEYLIEPKTEAQQRDEGASKVLAMMKRLMKKGTA